MRFLSKVLLPLLIAALSNCHASMEDGVRGRECSADNALAMLGSCPPGSRLATNESKPVSFCTISSEICQGKAPCNEITGTCGGYPVEFVCIRANKEGVNCVNDCECRITLHCDEETATCVAGVDPHRGGYREVWKDCSNLPLGGSLTVSIFDNQEDSFCAPQPGLSSEDYRAWVPKNSAVLLCDATVTATVKAMKADYVMSQAQIHEGYAVTFSIRTPNDGLADHLFLNAPAPQLNNHCMLYAWVGSLDQQKSEVKITPTFSAATGGSVVDLTTLNLHP